MFAITKWSQDQCTRDNVSKKERKERYIKPHYISHKHSPYHKFSYANPPLMYDYSHIKTTPPFCHE